jgi:hypothetical protein
MSTGFPTCTRSPLQSALKAEGSVLRERRPARVVPKETGADQDSQLAGADSKGELPGYELDALPLLHPAPLAALDTTTKFRIR